MKFRSPARQAIYDALKSGGESAALQAGKAHGVKESRVRRWCRKWSAAPASKGRVQQAKVYDKRIPDLFGAVVEAGEQVSSVRFEDGFTRYVTNDYLRCQCGKKLTKEDPCPLPAGKPCKELRH